MAGQRITQDELRRRSAALTQAFEARTAEYERRRGQPGYDARSVLERELRRTGRDLDDIAILGNRGYYTPFEERVNAPRGTQVDSRRAGYGRRISANIRTQFAASGGFGGLVGGPLGAAIGAGIGFGAGALIEGSIQSEIEEINASVIELADSFSRLAQVTPGIRALRENVVQLNEAFGQLEDDPFNRELRETTATRATATITQYERNIANLREQFNAAGES